MKTRKQQAWDRVQRLITHWNNPQEPVDAATLLWAESARLHASNHRLARRMSWAFSLAAAKLEACQDPAMLTRYQKIQ